MLPPSPLPVLDGEYPHLSFITWTHGELAGRWWRLGALLNGPSTRGDDNLRAYALEATSSGDDGADLVRWLAHWAPALAAVGGSWNWRVAPVLRLQLLDTRQANDLYDWLRTRHEWPMWSP